MISTLRDLHPAASDPVPELPDEAPTLQRVDLDVLSKIVKRSLNNGAAPAGSGWTGDLLYALIGDKDCLSAIGTLICDIINGKMALFENFYFPVLLFLLRSPLVVLDR